MQPIASLSRKQSVYCFDATAMPLASIDAPAVVLFETHDARGGRLTRPDQVEETTPDFSERFPRTNPATGPVFVRGAQPGDTVVVDVHAIELDPLGFILVKPDMGVLRDVVEKPLAQMCTIRDEQIRLGHFQFPVAPMVGVVAVAPRGEAIATAYVGRHGGNIDSKLIGVGARIRLPVQVPGALVYVGDVHAAMGDGEVTGTGVEVGARVTATIGLEKGTARTWPTAELEDRIVAIASAPTFEEASEIAVGEMVALLVETYSISRAEAFMLISATGDLGVNQACRSAIDVSARVVMPKLGRNLRHVERSQ